MEIISLSVQPVGLQIFTIRRNSRNFWMPADILFIFSVNDLENLIPYVVEISSLGGIIGKTACIVSLKQHADWSIPEIGSEIDAIYAFERWPNYSTAQPSILTINIIIVALSINYEYFSEI